jgi:predicted transcriptional regulator/DNA-binding XRE family transcriptional regulator
MAEQKIFAGPRIRRMRHELDLTQTAMAEQLGISPSYLNLIERNQRPLTVQLLLRLSSVFRIDLDELRGEAGGLAASLKEVFADPLLSDDLPSPQELVEVAEAAPNAAAGFVKLYRAYRESLGRLSDLSDLLAREGRETGPASARLPLDEVHDAFEKRPNHFPAIEEAADAFLAAIPAAGDLQTRLKNWLREAHDISVRTLPVHAMPQWRRRFDRHSMRLFLSERLSPFDQLREIAMEVALRGLREPIDEAARSMHVSEGEALRLARIELARYAAHAIMMPLTPFREAATRLRCDIDALAARFGVSFEHAANRLTMLSPPGKPGIPFFFLEVDSAGNRVRRAGAHGFPQARFGGACPKLPVHAAFAQPGQVIVERVEMPDGAEFLVAARTLEGPQASFNERVRRTAILIGCDAGFAGDTVYGPAAANALPPVGVGPACRLCERQGCLARAEPPLTRPLGLDEMVTGLNVFDFR